MFGCLESCFGRLRGSSEEEEPLFPPPDTVLTPPRPRPPPIRSFGAVHDGASTSGGICSASSTWRLRDVSSASSLVLGRKESSQSVKAERERIESISRAFAGRMKPLHFRRSLPPTPTSLHSRHVHYTHNSTSTQTTPGIYTQTFANAQEAHHALSRRLSQSRAESSNRTGMGRSVSEPRNLAALDSFAQHQIPSSSTGGRNLVVHRGRQRSATTVDRMSPLSASPDTSPVEDSSDMLSPDGARLRSGTLYEGIRGRRGRSPLSLCDSHRPREASASAQGSPRNQDSEDAFTTPRFAFIHDEDADEEASTESEVTQVALGLEMLGSRDTRRARGRGRGGRLGRGRRVISH